MLIQGLQKMTLLDFPTKVACTIFTAGCNLRCPFCHNALLVTEIDNSSTIPTQEIFDFLKKRQGVLDGVAITGGEPLLQPDIKDFIINIRKLGFLVKLDTNGSFPQKLIELVEEKLVDYVAVDIKNSKEKYALTTGVKDYDLTNIEKTVDFLLHQNIIDYEFRTTVVKEFHTPEDILNITEWIKYAKHYYLQNFVDSGALIQEGLSQISPIELQKMLNLAKIFVPSTLIRGL